MQSEVCQAQIGSFIWEAVMTFGEKLKNARNALNLSQIELAEKIGITERSVYSYEQAGIIPRKAVLIKIAGVLNVSVAYLMDEEETDRHINIDTELFITDLRNKHGYKAAREASEVLSRASALFAGGELDEEAKEIFIQSLMEVYLESKAEAREKFGNRRIVKTRKE
jgi:transcriptional regulator with XRE-family HTH domain